MTTLKLTQTHSDYPTRGEALLAALTVGDPMPKALAYAGLGASTVTGYLKRSTFDPGDGSYERFQASEGGKACRHLFKTMSRLRVTVELAMLEQEPLSSEWWKLLREEIGYASVWPYKRLKLERGFFGREEALLDLYANGFPPVVHYLDRLRDSLIAAGEPAPTTQLLVDIYA
jgi:hypothetical protein